QVLERVVFELVCQVSMPAVDLHGLVYVPPLPARGPAIVEAKLIVRIEVGGGPPPAEVKRDARQAVAAQGRLGGKERLDLRGERRRHALVRVQREDPVVRRE